MLSLVATVVLVAPRSANRGARGAPAGAPTVEAPRQVTAGPNHVRLHDIPAVAVHPKDSNIVVRAVGDARNGGDGPGGHGTCRERRYWDDYCAFSNDEGATWSSNIRVTTSSINRGRRGSRPGPGRGRARPAPGGPPGRPRDPPTVLWREREGAEPAHH